MPGRPYADFVELWRARREALAKSQEPEAKRLLGEIVTAKNASGWPDILVLGEALAQEAQSTAVTDLERAQGLAEAAVALAPHHPATHVVLAKVQWGVGDYGGAARTFWRAVMTALGEPPLARAVLGSVLMAVAAAICAAVVLLALMVLIRNISTCAHDLWHLLPRGAQRWQAALLVLWVLAIPFFLRIGIVWAVIICLVLLAPYMQRRERAGAVLGLLLLGGSSFGLPYLTSHLVFPASRSQDVYESVRDAGAIGAAQRLAARPQLGAEELWALGLRARWEGRLKDANDQLARAAAVVNDEHLLIALGNARYLGSEYAEAATVYEKAAQLNANSVTALFNLSLAQYALGNHEKGRDIQRQALQIDLDRVEQLREAEKKAKAAGVPFIVEEEVPQLLLSVPLDLNRLHYQTVRQIWTTVAGRAPRNATAISALGAAVLVLLFAFLRKLLSPSARCVRCGRPACRRCAKASVSGATSASASANASQTHGTCAECQRAASGKPEDAAERVRKEIEAHRHKLRTIRLRQVLSVLFAGAAQMARGSTALGILLVSSFVASGILLASSLSFLPSLLPVDTGLYLVGAVLSGLVCACAYIIGLVDGLKEER